MSNQRNDRAAEILWSAWNTGDRINGFPAAITPVTRQDGYDVQSAYVASASSPVAGWKIAATSAAGQAHINVDGPIAGRILEDRICPSGATIALTANEMLVCEPEFAFRFGEALVAGRTYTKETVLKAVSAMHPTLEVPDSRFTDFTAVGAPSLIADNACARELIVGPAVEADWRGVDLSNHPVQAEVTGKYTREGSGVAVLGDPRDALTWLVNEVCGAGMNVEPGELVTTGTCMIPLEVAPGDEVVADYGSFGAISVRFSA